MLAPETILQSRYRIIRQLGQGGMGAVYEALDQRLDTTVALKETLFTDERLSKQFEREARLLARLHHPALPRVSDHFSEGEGQFLVMQFIPGDDLSAMMSQKRAAFPLEQVLTWGDQLLDALDYLHTQEPQIVHRDIKPQNLKLTGRGQVILLDFGLAKGQAGDVSRITSSASIFGYTPNYAPLEQIQGLGTDSRSDIYSLAATLYHLITGVKPPDALTRAAALVNGQEDPLRRANELNNAVPVEFAQVLQRAMAQNREQRYSSAAEMRKSLNAVDEVQTTTNRGEAQTILFPTTGPQSTQAFAGKPTIATTDETTVVRNVGPRKTSRSWLTAAVLVLVSAVGVCAIYLFQRRNSSTPLTADHAAVTAVSPAAATPSTSSAPIVSVGGNIASPESPKADNKQKTADAKTKKVEKSGRNQETRNPQALRPVPPEPNGHEVRTDIDTEFPDPDVPVPNRPRAPRTSTRVTAGGVVIKTFPNGAQVITMPDGGRVFVSPDGKKQILQPGQKVNRRRVPATP